MKVKAERNDLLSLLGHTQSIIETRNTMPALNNVLLKTKKGILQVFATNLEVSLINHIEADIEKNGAVAVNSKSLFSLIKELSSLPIELEGQKNNGLKIKQGRSVFNIVGIEPEQYPSFPTFETQDFTEIKASVLSEMIDKTIFSVSSDETRYHLNGVYFEKIGSNELKMVSTDGHRLSLVNRLVDPMDSSLPTGGVIIPRRGLNEIKRLVEFGKGTFQVAVKGSQLVVHQGTTTLIIRLIEGKFPNYQRLIPQNSSERVMFDREKLLSSLKRVSLLSNQKSRSVVLDLSEGLVKISSSDPSLGDAKEELEIDYQGQDMQISFNVKYMMDVLCSMNEEEVDMELKDKLSAGLLRPHGDKNHTCVIMPVRV